MREYACAFDGSAHLSFSGTQVSNHRHFGRFQYCSTRSSRLQTACYTLAARRSSWSLLRLAFCGHATCRREAATWMHPRTRLQKRCLQCYRMRWSLWCPGRGLRCAPSVKPVPAVPYWHAVQHVPRQTLVLDSCRGHIFPCFNRPNADAQAANTCGPGWDDTPLSTPHSTPVPARATLERKKMCGACRSNLSFYSPGLT